MRNGLKFYDLDRHVMEPVSLWREYLPTRLHHLVPDLQPARTEPECLTERLERLGDYALLPSPPILTVAGKPLYRALPESANIEVGLRVQERIADMARSESGAGQLAAMDGDGIDVALLLPTHASFLVYDDDIDAEASRGYATAYSRWLADQCQEAPARLLGAALISRHDPDAMVGDLEVALRAGHRAVVLRPNMVAGRTLGAPELEPFYAACEAQGVPIMIHEGAHARVPTAGADRFATHFAQISCSHTLEAMMSFVALLEGGVLERHPLLRVCWLESGCGWLPYWLGRLDNRFELLANEVRGRVNRPPSEYFRRQCWIAFEPDEPMLAEMVAAIGPQRVVFGTDFPHVDHEADIATMLFVDRAPLGTEALRAVLCDSPARLLG